MNNFRKNFLGKKKKRVPRSEEDKRDVHFEVGLNVSSDV